MTEVRTISATGGEKGEKPERYDLIPVGPLADIARVFGYGATKYEDRNWERGYEWHKSYAALQRHLNAFWGGESIDPESGLPHLAHAGAHVLFLMLFEGHHPNFDDRSKLVKVADLPPVEEAGPSNVITITACSWCGHSKGTHVLIGGGSRHGKFTELRGPCGRCNCSQYTEWGDEE